MTRSRIFVWTLLGCLHFTLLGQYLVPIERGRQALEEGRPDSAANAFRQALDQEEARGLSPELMFPVRMALTAAYLESGDVRNAERTLRDASQLETGPASEVARAELANNWASLHLIEGRFEKARTEFADALSRVMDRPECRMVVAQMLNNLASAEVHSGIYPRAMAHQQEALQRWQNLLPPDHPNLIKGYASLSTVQYLLNNAPGAKTSMEAAIASARRAYGNRSPILANLLESDAIILRSLGLKHDGSAAEKEVRGIRKYNGLKPRNPAPAAYTFDARPHRGSDAVEIVFK